MRTGRVLLELVRSRDWRGLAARVESRVRGRPGLLPEDLPPQPRVLGLRPAKLDGPIIMATPSLALDGAPLSQLELTKGLVKQGRRILTVSSRPGPLSDAYAASGLDLEVWPALGVDPSLPAVYERQVAQLARELAARAPGMVYANTVDTFAVIDAARAAGLPSIWNIREGEHWRQRLADRHPCIAARAAACFAYPEAVIFVARAIQQSWQPFVSASNARVVYNAIAEPKRWTDFVAARKSDFDILSIGVLCPRKGQIDLVDAYFLLPEHIRNRCRVVLVGRDDGGYAKTMRSRIPRRWKDSFVFQGEILDVAPLLSSSSVLAHTARVEAFPRVLIEAAAAGLPIVATRAGGTGERLEHGRSALMYDAGDAKALAQHMARVFDEPETGLKLAREARLALVDRCTFEDMVGAYDREFSAALLEGAQHVQSR